MRRDKAVKTQRRKALKSRNAARAARRRKPSDVNAYEKIALLEHRLNETLEQQTATSEVLRVISSSPGELEPVFQAMLENARRICEAEFGVLNRCEGDALRVVAMHGAPQPYVEERRKNPIIRPPPATALGRALATKQPVQIADVLNEPHYFDAPSGYSAVLLTKLSGARTVLAVPMLKENELIGAIVIYRTEVRPFTDKQIELVQNFAAQAVIAIENARLLNELRQSLEQQTATADVLKVISRSTFDLQTVLDTLVESAARLCGAEMANIWRPRDGAYRLTASYGVTARYKESLENEEFLNTIAIEPGRGTTVGRVLLERKSVHIHDIQADPDYKLSGLVALGGTRTMLGIPMLREGDPIGVLVLVQSAVRPFTDKQIELATTFADQAVIAIENVRLFEEVQARTRDLTESLEQQTATSEVLKVISSSPGDLKPVFEAMLESATRICGAGFGAMFRIENGEFEPVAFHNVPEVLERHLTARGKIRPRSGSTMERVMRTKDVVHVVDLWQDADGPGNPASKYGNARTYLGVPMLNDNELVGAIVIFRQEVKPFGDKQVELVKNFASQAVIAIENVRLLSELRQREQDLTEKSTTLAALSSKLAKYLAPQVYNSIFTGQQDVKIVSARKKLTVCFSDLVGFTEITDQMESEDLTQLLNQYLTEMSKIALQYGATIDKYVGDAIVMFFGDPTTLGVKQDALACVQMAIAMQQRVGELAQEWRGIGIGTPLRCRIGIHTGYCTVGNFGSEDRMDYTMVGGTVNLASRLEHEAPPGGILISFETYAHVQDEVHCEERGQVQVKGIAHPVATYAVLGPKQDAERDVTAHLQLDLDPERMTDDERRAAAEKLRRALGLLEKGAKPNG